MKRKSSVIFKIWTEFKKKKEEKGFLFLELKL